MKKAKGSDDAIAAEYPFASMKGGVRGKYAARLDDAIVVRLDPDVAAVFPTEKAVNEALRGVMQSHGHGSSTLRRKPAASDSRKRGR